MKKINRKDILQLLEENRKPNTIFNVVFLKKSGEIRRMSCLFGVKKYLGQCLCWIFVDFPMINNRIHNL